MDSHSIRFHHLGLAVRSPEKSLAFLRGQGYSIGTPVLDMNQNVNAILCAHASLPCVEVLYRTEKPGPLDAVLRESGEALYHLCYTCADVDSTVEEMKKHNRVIPVSEPKPAVLFGGKRVSFYRVVGFGLIELIAD